MKGVWVSENLQKLVGVVVMAVLVVVGVAVSSGDDTDYTRNVSFRDNPERLEGGDRLEDPDCCDQNAYEISLLQAKYEDLEVEIVAVQKALESADKTLESAQKAIEKLEDESCSNVDGSARCAFIDHRELVVPLDNVGAVWVSKSSGSNACKVGQGILNWGLGMVGSEVGIDLGSVDLCSSTYTVVSDDLKNGENVKTEDKYLRFWLECPRVANFVPRDHYLYKDYGDPTITMWKQLSSSEADYWIAPQAESTHQSAGWQLDIGLGNLGASKAWKTGAARGLVSWTFDKSAMNIYGVADADSFATRGITVIIEDKETGEHHYAIITASVGYRVAANDLNELKEGKAQGRCEADLTFIRSYS